MSHQSGISYMLMEIVLRLFLGADEANMSFKMTLIAYETDISCRAHSSFNKKHIA